MTDAVVVAMIVAVPTTIAPVLLRITDSKARRAEKMQDYARQDEVAKRLEAAQLATRRQVQHIEQAATEEREVLSGKLDMIHSFVNSDMTGRMRTELALMREIVALRTKGGDEPTQDSLDAITRLEAEIAERDWQQAIADKALADSAKEVGPKDAP